MYRWRVTPRVCLWPCRPAPLEYPIYPLANSEPAPPVDRVLVQIFDALEFLFRVKVANAEK